MIKKYIYIKQYENFITENEEDFLYKIAGYKHDEKTIKYQIVYHVTSIEKANNILLKGFIKNKPSPNEPHATYLTPDIYGAISLAKNLSQYQKKKTDWCILEINSSKLTLYSDPYSIKESGVYTYDDISPKLIKIKSFIDCDIIKNQTNWKLFWKWWFWNIGGKPTFIKMFSLPQYKK